VKVPPRSIQNSQPCPMTYVYHPARGCDQAGAGALQRVFEAS
jgi:hypothetical protein